MARQRSSARATRRSRARERQRLVRDLDRLARLEPGGSPTHPLPVASPAQVEVIAAARACPLCRGTLRLEEHAAEVVAGVRLRIARVACTVCGTRRAFYFTLAAMPIH
jgi:hypothetical protein